MNYRLLALDVDGTLLGADGRVSRDAREAVAAVCEAGLGVCLATGRSYVETLPVWRQLPLKPPFEPLVLIGGALVSEPDTARTLYHLPMDRALAGEFADALAEQGYPAMAIVDAWRHEVEYYLVESGDARGADRRWFSKMDVTVRRVGRLGDVPDLPPPLRVSTVADADEAGPLAERLARRFGDRLKVHAILAPNYGVTIVEAFAPGASKFEALRYVGQARGIAPARIAAVGDDVNDVEMVAGAGLGAAMPTAPQALRDAADVRCPASLASFIHDLLDGAYDGPGATLGCAGDHDEPNAKGPSHGQDTD
ncbi:MAG: HAD-IIB family hydrolase [Planctomycetota bacterium]